MDRLIMPENHKFADVYIGLPIDDSFTYIVPHEMNVLPGMRVIVDFNNRLITAFIHRVHSDAPDLKIIKEINTVIDKHPIFDSRLIDLSQYTASTYLSSIGEALAMALPSGEKSSKRFKHPFEKKDAMETELTKEQKNIFNNIINSYKKNRIFHLIFGITGSGKTEIYLELAKHVIAQGRSVIYLVPEIMLSSQIFERLYNQFSDDLIVYHSHLTRNQRLYSWEKFYSGEAKIVVGTRSAVFLQCPNLGLIIIDEEHDGSYKEHSTPRYHVRNLVYYRCREENAIMLMGSATPSIESLYAVEMGAIELHNLKGRYGEANLPEIEIIKINPKNRVDMLTSKLILFTKKAIDKGRQVIFLLNRRGFSPIVLCNDCGNVLECPFCNISLNYHKDNVMLCHYCGYRQPLSESCVDCGSEDIIKLGSGTQRIEDVIRDTFANINIFRLDQDTSRKKNTGYDLIKKMNNGEIDILLGTQMVAKGFDFSNVSLVGVLLADIGLNMPDFRSSEKILSLLIQIAGRCGRGNVPGKVIIQTLNEDHSIFRYLKNHDYLGFYRYEQSVRRMLNYPPFSRLARLLVRGKEREKVVNAVNMLKETLDKIIKKNNSSIQLLGPSDAPIAKIANNHRCHIILKSKNLEELKRIIRETKRNLVLSGVYLEIDIDPYDMM